MISFYQSFDLPLNPRSAIMSFITFYSPFLLYTRHFYNGLLILQCFLVRLTKLFPLSERVRDPSQTPSPRQNIKITSVPPEKFPSRPSFLFCPPPRLRTPSFAWRTSQGSPCLTRPRRAASLSCCGRSWCSRAWNHVLLCLVLGFHVWRSLINMV